MIAQKKTNKKKIRSLFKEAILIPDIIFEAIKIKIPILVYCFDEFVIYFVLLRLIINPFLYCFYSPLVKYVILSDTSIFLIEIF